MSSESSWACLWGLRASSNPSFAPLLRNDGQFPWCWNVVRFAKGSSVTEPISGNTLPHPLVCWIDPVRQRPSATGLPSQGNCPWFSGHRCPGRTLPEIAGGKMQPRAHFSQRRSSLLYNVTLICWPIVPSRTVQCTLIASRAQADSRLKSLWALRGGAGVESSFNGRRHNPL